LKLALWQTAGYPADIPANLAALDAAARAASAAGAALLLCPECWLCGYNIGGVVLALAEPADGPSAQRIAAIAREHRLAIVYGYAERAHTGQDERIFNSVQAIGPDGAVLAHYRKTHLFGPAERAAYQPGACFAAPFVFGGLRIGLLVCYDIEFPEAARSLALAGADLLLVPTALTDEYGTVPALLVPARAVENQLHVAYCNHAGVENGMRFLGRSCLIAPDGQPVVAAGAGEALIVGDIDLEVARASAKIYPYRADRRPELYGAVQAPHRHRAV
jgi:5-aminopentanamidase